MIKLIIFDLWDTLVYRDCEYSTTGKMLEVTKSKIPNDKFVKIFENSLQTKKWRSEFKMYENLCKNMGLRASRKNVNTLMKIRRYAVSKTKLFPHTISMLDKLKKGGYKIGLLSNSSIFDIKQIKRKISLLNYIDYPLFAYDVRVIKPNLLFFKRMLKIAKVKPNETIMIGDDLNDDIIPSKKLGFNTIYFTTYQKLKNDFSKFSIKI